MLVRNSWWDQRREKRSDFAANLFWKMQALRRKGESMKTVEPMADGVRYRRLRLLGCAPTESENLKNGTVLRFTNLDRFVDADLVNYPNRGDKPFEQAESLAELALRNIACFLGVGGHNAPLVDAWAYEEKILDAIAHPIPPPSGEREKMGDLQDRCCVALEKDDDELRADAERLDTLDGLGYSYGFEDMHEGNRWVIEGPFKSVRDAIDDAKTNASKPPVTICGNCDMKTTIVEPAVIEWGDLVLVPKGLIGSACSAITHKRDAPITVQQLRRYITGDLSKSPPPSGELAPNSKGINCQSKWPFKQNM